MEFGFLQSGLPLSVLHLHTVPRERRLAPGVSLLGLVGSCEDRVSLGCWHGGASCLLFTAEEQPSSVQAFQPYALWDALEHTMASQ